MVYLYPDPDQWDLDDLPIPGSAHKMDQDRCVPGTSIVPEIISFMRAVFFILYLYIEYYANPAN
jgi:hypothetical protein